MYRPMVENQSVTPLRLANWPHVTLRGRAQPERCCTRLSRVTCSGTARPPGLRRICGTPSVPPGMAVHAASPAHPPLLSLRARMDPPGAHMGVHQRHARSPAADDRDLEAAAHALRRGSQQLAHDPPKPGTRAPIRHAPAQLRGHTSTGWRGVWACERRGLKVGGFLPWGLCTARRKGVRAGRPRGGQRT
jgi:hypothetical protein